MQKCSGQVNPLVAGSSPAGPTTNSVSCMSLLEILKEQRQGIIKLATAYGADDVRVFGSVARGEEGPNSDVDFLVTLPIGYDMFKQRIPLSNALSELISRPVDLVPEHELNKHLRIQILAEAVSL